MCIRDRFISAASADDVATESQRVICPRAGACGVSLPKTSAFAEKWEWRNGFQFDSLTSVSKTTHLARDCAVARWCVRDLVLHSTANVVVFWVVVTHSIYAVCHCFRTPDKYCRQTYILPRILSSSTFFFFLPPNLRARWTELTQNRPHARK